MQQAIVKKKQCDAKALAIVEQLLEPNMDSDWLLQNLQFINKAHLEDVIEERVIIKLCGYVLCSKPLTVVVKQQYRISTRTNKVYDISKRKNFCSSSCYGASNYLLEQMLESPLWLRRKEDIPVFKILPINSVQSLPGDEINVVGNNFLQDTNTDNIGKSKELLELNTNKQTKDHPSQTILNSEIENCSSNDTNVEGHTQVEEIPVNINAQNQHETYPLELCTNQEDKEYNPQECTNPEYEYSDHVQKEDVKLENVEKHIAVQINNNLQEQIQEHINKNIENENTNVRVINNNSDSEILYLQPNDISNTESKNTDSKKISSQLDDVIDSNNAKDDKTVQFQLDRACSKQNITISSKTSNEAKNKPKKIKSSNINKNKHRQEEFDNAEVRTNMYHNLVIHVEQSFREWVTKNTLCLLLGEQDEKSQLLENLTQRDRYEQLCKKLNRLQLQDEKEDRAELAKNALKPLPHLSVLQEEGKKIELKVRAFYKGQMVISENNGNKLKNQDELEESILPLTDAYAPNALRRRIFLDKLNKVLPDLLCALTRLPANTNTSVTQHICINTYSLIKLLVSTFHLTAKNIVFNTAEWTLVGLIIIKMLSLIDKQLRSVLESKQASMYMSMILMSYKLNSGYLDRLIVDVINNENIHESCNK
ncbi:RNA polymerase II subunit B1 CTD phosphatase Rpap2 isoform X2 [Harpegnathos saltator]|nr:RNA polymerase II subunit B1 CTD phosphatase Rpap2 isoform X2 [Harpegnathos saltator]